jgi:hypothetical protein
MHVCTSIVNKTHTYLVVLLDSIHYPEHYTTLI